jgi:hypothetical protein
VLLQDKDSIRQRQHKDKEGRQDKDSIKHKALKDKAYTKKTKH